MLFFHNGIIIESNSKEQAVATASKSSGIRLYILSRYDETYLFAFNCGSAKQLKKFGFEPESHFYIKPLNTTTANDLRKYSIESDGYAKLKKFKNPNALKVVKKNTATASSVEVWYAVIENQGMLVSKDKLIGFLKVPYKPLCKEITSVSMAQSIVDKIQKSVVIDNFEELNKSIKVLFGSELKGMSIDENKPTPKKDEPEEAKNYQLEFTQQFLKEQYDLFNARYFGNSLPKDLPLSWQTTSGRAGACFWKYTINGIQPVEIKMSRTAKTYNDFRDTLVHEMCHASCYLVISPEKLKEAERLGKPMSTPWKKYLELTDDTAHTGRFAWLTERLNSKFPELNLGRFSHDDHFNKDENGNIKNEALEKLATAHLLVREDQGKKILFLVTQELYEKTLKNIKSSPESKFPPYRGIWTEYFFKPEVMARFTTNVTDTLTMGFKYKCLGEIRRIGALKPGMKYLGGSTIQVSPWDVRQSRP